MTYITGTITNNFMLKKILLIQINNWAGYGHIFL